MYDIRALERFLTDGRHDVGGNEHEIWRRAVACARNGLVGEADVLEVMLGSESLASCFKNEATTCEEYIRIAHASQRQINLWAAGQNLSQSVMPVHAVREAMAMLPFLPWRVNVTGDGAGVVAFVKLNGSREERDFVILSAMERAHALPHLHLGNPGDEGELIMTLAGELHDVRDDGSTVVLKPGDKLRHAGGSRHQPYAPVFWLGIYRQKIGTRIISP